MNQHGRILTEVSALDGAVVKRYAQIVTRLAELRDGDSIRAPDDPGFVVILPIIRFTEKGSECAMTCHLKRKCSKAIRAAVHLQESKNTQQKDLPRWPGTPLS